jgi:tetratricopeptide (TPR) repeat protein
MAHRRKQKRLVFGLLLGILGLAGAWQVYSYIGSAPERAAREMDAGMKLMHPGTYDEAIVKFTAALEIEPNSWNAYQQRGLANMNVNRPDAALADLQTALQLKPNLLDALVARATIYGDQGDRQHAVQELSKVIDLQPSQDARYRRGSFYAELGQHEQAIADFTWVIEELRDAPYAYFGRAKSRRALGDLAGAAEDDQIAHSFNRAASLRK